MNTFSDPRKIIEQLPIFSGQKIADFGAGNGAYTFELAKKTQKGSNQGAVYAIDVVQNMVEQIAAEARTQNLNTVHAIWSDLESEKGSKLRDSSIQAVVIANTLFQAEHPARLIKEARRILTDHGILIVIDWRESFGNIGPKEGHIITEDAARLMVEEHGFTIDKSLTAGEHHYGFVANINPTNPLA
jgi:ubiquinone/menaquinone biosynthesis C-methylase UbiE